MRNIFDQYSQPENRITHALITALHEDRRLLGLFLHELVKTKPPCHPRNLTLLEQQYPGEEELSEEELEKRGIPDGWIFEENGWCVFLESKVLAKLSADQIIRHRRTAERRGFNTITAVAITPRAPASPRADTVLLEWRDIYAWLCSHAPSSEWAGHTARYLEIEEAKLIENEKFVEGTLTMFSGFPFERDHPFTYLEGKRILKLALDKLRRRSDLRKQLKMNPEAPGRPAITGRQRDAVWDFLSLASVEKDKTFTEYPHLTLIVAAQYVEAMVIVPNAVNPVMRSNIIGLGENKFRTLIAKVFKNLKPLLRSHEGATPLFRGVQRRFPSRKASPLVDAQIDFDLRTVVPGGPPKMQPQWLSAAYNSFVHKKGSNYQIQVGVAFPYDRCPELKQADALDLVAAAWIACEPLVDLAR